MTFFEYFFLYMTVRVDPSYTGDTIDNTAYLMCLDPEGNYANNEATLTIAVTHPTVPAPGAVLLGTIGVGFVRWLHRRRTL